MQNPPSNELLMFKCFTFPPVFMAPSTFLAVKTRSLLHGQRTSVKCSQQPALICPPRCPTWCTRTEPLRLYDSTCLAWRTSAPWRRKAEREKKKKRGIFVNKCIWCVVHSLLVCVSVVRIQKLPRLLVASSDGYLYIYNVDPQDGGECVLVQKHR